MFSALLWDGDKTVIVHVPVVVVHFYYSVS